MATISTADLMWALADVIADAETLDREALRDARKAVAVLPAADVKVAVLEALNLAGGRA